MIVDDDPAFASLLEGLLKKQGFLVSKLIDSIQVMGFLARNECELVLVDYRMPGLNGLQLLEQIRAQKPNLPVILITNYADLRVAVSSIKLGAYDYITKPIVPDEFIAVINRALIAKRSGNERPDMKTKEIYRQEYIVGSCTKAKEVWDYACKVAPTGLNVLITGESGTGKEYIARALHNMSRRANQPFVSVDCGTISSDLAISSFFGHVKGAFTGANSDKTGLFEQANRGTLFLDEVGNLAVEVQIALLRAIQERKYKRLGASREQEVDLRIVAATNESLSSAVSQGIFRNDLYHRLNEFELHIPPLRKRLVDIEVYSSAFLRQSELEFKKENLTIDPEVFEAFKGYQWPGNLRELRNIIRRATLLAKNQKITLNEIPDGLLDWGDQLDRESDNQLEKRSKSYDIKKGSRELERDLIIKALEKSKYNKSKAAKALNIDRTTLYSKLKSYGIDA